MKTVLLIVLLIASSSDSFAHKYYFGFAEVEYDFFTQRFEATLTVTAHDLELALANNGTAAGDLENLDSIQTLIVEEYINSSFKIQSEDSKCQFNLIGHETELNGNIHFYLESSQIAVNKTIEVEFDILMDNYQEQQNKITLYYLEQAYTLAFTRVEHIQTIQLENINE